jgi:hypothetical protein
MSVVATEPTIERRRPRVLLPLAAVLAAVLFVVTIPVLASLPGMIRSLGLESTSVRITILIVFLQLVVSAGVIRHYVRVRSRLSSVPD